jgi:hypothetical protein
MPFAMSLGNRVAIGRSSRRLIGRRGNRSHLGQPCPSDRLDVRVAGQADAD